MSPKILDLILSGYLSLLKINASKKFHSRGRLISLVWQRLSKFREPALNKVWDDFMSDLYANLDELNNSIVGILKSLYPTLMSLLNKKDGRDARLLIKVFQENLHALEPAWVSRYLHQIVANLASNDEHTFWFYVSITEFLASKKLAYNVVVDFKLQYVQSLSDASGSPLHQGYREMRPLFLSPNKAHALRNSY